VAEARGPVRFAPPQAWESAMLITPATPEVLGGAMSEPPARPRAGLQTPGALAPLLVGAGCRVCAQADCPARREPSIVLGRG